MKNPTIENYLLNFSVKLNFCPDIVNFNKSLLLKYFLNFF